MSKKMLLPVGIVVLIIGVVILLLNPDPATTNLEIAIKPMLGCILSACSVVVLACP